jgi:uncharacterized protein YjbI with pentapeptide repeats
MRRTLLVWLAGGLALAGLAWAWVPNGLWVWAHWQWALGFPATFLVAGALALVLDLTQLKLARARYLSTALRFRIGLGNASLIALWLWVVLAWPVLNWLYPVFLGYELPRYLAAAAVLVGLATFCIFWLWAVVRKEDGSQEFWQGWAERHEKFLRLSLNADQQKTYKWHVRWRFALLARQTKRAWQRANLREALKKQRWLIVLAAAVSTFALLGTLAWYLSSAQSFSDIFSNQNARTQIAAQIKGLLKNSTGSWTLLTALLSAPIAYFIWWFRDTNNLWQIENQRKDINLKDFQKLAEWASGLHLVEDKTSTSEKFAGHPSDAPTETTRHTESSAAPRDALLQTPSRREGSASLQIAAVTQLQAFLHGEFGRHFEKPAFALLTSIWLSLMQKHVAGWTDKFLEDLSKSQRLFQEEQEKTPYGRWRKNLQNAAQTPLAKAITQVLAAQHGRSLRQHQAQLPSLCLAGMNSRLPGLEPLELDGLGMHGINWQGADLSEAQLQGAFLSEAQLQGADLLGAQLQGAVLSFAQLQGAYLNDAQLQGANLLGAQLQGAYLSWAQLQGADLNGAQLHGAYLSKAQLQGATLCNPHINPETDFANCECDEKTWVGVVKTPRGPDRKDWDIHPLATHALRLKLREINDLQLHESAYTEYLAQWNALNEAEQKHWLANAYENAASGAQLQRADLSGAKLQRADLSGAKLQRADLSGAKLQGTDLSKAQLQGATLCNPHINSETDFANCECDEKTWVGVTPDFLFGWLDRKDWNIHPLATHALRLKLREANDLKLHESAYTEFQAEWDALNEAEQKYWLANAYKNAANPDNIKNP